MLSLNSYYKNSHGLSQMGTRGSESMSPLWPPLPGKAMKLSFSTSPKTVSKISRGTRIQRNRVFSISLLYLLFDILLDPGPAWVRVRQVNLVMSHLPLASCWPLPFNTQTLVFGTYGMVPHGSKTTPALGFLTTDILRP